MMKIENLKVEEVFPNPVNRKFEKSGEEWESFVSSVRARGVITPVLVRPFGDGYELIAGERRWTAAGVSGLESIPAMVRRDLSDQEALELMLIENFQREDLDPIEAAKGIAELVRVSGLDSESLSARLNKPVEWVSLRQGLLELDDEVQAYVSSRRVELAVVQMILHLPSEFREEAVQLVLHPSYQEDPLNARAAERILEKKIIEPARERKAWQEREGVLKSAWTVALRGVDCPDENLDAVNVQIAEWSDELPAGEHQAAMDEVYEVELTGDAPHGCRWVNLAQRHGLPVVVYARSGANPDDEKRAGSIALVNVAMVNLGERALEECEEVSQKAWLESAKKKSRGKKIDPDEREDEEELKNEESRNSQVIDQRMELRVWIDMGEVMRLRSSAEWVYESMDDGSMVEEDEEWDERLWGLSAAEVNGMVRALRWVEGLGDGKLYAIPSGQSPELSLMGGRG